MEIRNPRTGQFDYEIFPPSFEQLKIDSQRLKTNQEEWHANGIEYRIQALEEWKKVLLDHREEITDTITIDTGRYHESVLEFNLLPTSIDRWVKYAKIFFGQQNDKDSEVPFIRIQQENVPYSLVSVISPWNFPLLLSVIDTIPALMAGCAVMVKPSEVTPRFVQVIQSTIDAVPALQKVLMYVEGAGEQGSQMLELADITCFTGSVATGLKVYQKSASLFKPCFLELGGKDAALVFEGADIKRAAKSILWGSTVNCGHSCLSIERVYVQNIIFEVFTRLLKEESEKIKLATEDPKNGHIGPVISQRQVEIIDTHLADALAKGAQLVTGFDKCQIINGGYYCRPTILTNVNHDMLVMTEETFGPIIPIMSFETEEEAIRLANGTKFGLSGAVFAKDTETALEVAKRMQAGAISINECALTAVVHDGEKNSFKMSGIGGTRMGPASLQRFFRKKAYLINQNSGESPWWYKA